MDTAPMPVRTKKPKVCESGLTRCYLIHSQIRVLCVPVVSIVVELWAVARERWGFPSPLLRAKECNLSLDMGPESSHADDYICE